MNVEILEELEMIEDDLDLDLILDLILEEDHLKEEIVEKKIESKEDNLPQDHHPEDQNQEAQAKADPEVKEKTKKIKKNLAGIYHNFNNSSSRSKSPQKS
jgi:hypothetical protein